jgi:putative ABC transport system permease protein
MISIMLFTSVFERTREIGTYRALGYRKKDLRRIFVWEAILVGLIGLIISVIFTKLIEVTANQIGINQFNIAPFELIVKDIITGGIIVLLITVIAGILPAIRASKIDPVEALRYE